MLCLQPVHRHVVVQFDIACLRILDRIAKCAGMILSFAVRESICRRRLSVWFSLTPLNDSKSDCGEDTTGRRLLRRIPLCLREKWKGFR